MSFVEAVMAYYGLDQATTTQNGIMGDNDGLTVMLSLRIPNDLLPEIVALMDGE